MRGFLSEPIYAMRAKDVVKKNRVISAGEMRARLGLREWQLLVLLLFDSDEILEAMWARGAKMVWQLAEAGYDLIVPPSFSTYSPRPRTEFLINVRRSMLYFAALQEAHIPALPRVAWQVSHDAKRFAAWVNANPAVRTVALDWSTYRCAPDWQDQLQGLEVFESHTSRRLKYFINGVTTKDRAKALFSRVSPDRVGITNATTQARVALPKLRLPGDRTGAMFSARREARRRVLAIAAAEIGDARPVATRHAA